MAKSKRELNVGSSEHLGLSHLTGKSVERKPSAISDHLLLHNHLVCLAIFQHYEIKG